MRNTKTVLVTGAAGFIGFHLARRLMRDGYFVVGIDNLNDYYDVNLKNARLRILHENRLFQFEKLNIANSEDLNKVFGRHGFDVVFHLAAQVGVRYSLKNPHAYIESNLVGFANILEICRHFKTPHLIYASSSSVYGSNAKIPFSVRDPVDHPVSLYAATKRSNELMAYSYAHLYQLPCTGLRFFTVYGPWGRPDMSYFLFAKAIYEGRPIEIFNQGHMSRDFTYIDDIVEGMIRLLDKIPQKDSGQKGEDQNPSVGAAPFKIYNIGNNQPVQLLHFIEIIEATIGRRVEKKFLPLQAGDMVDTYADVDDLMSAVDFKPKTPMEYGIQQFVSWYTEFYQQPRVTSATVS